MLGPFQMHHRFTVRFEFGCPGAVDQNNAWGAKIMAAIADVLAQLKTDSDAGSAALDAAVQRAVDTATKNKATIADLKAGGGLTPEQLAALTAIETTVAAMAPKADGIDPTTPTTIPPPPGSSG